MLHRVSCEAAIAPTLRCGGDTAPVTDRHVPIDRILAARSRLAGHVHRTPMLGSATAAAELGAIGGPSLADGRVWLKAEHMQKTGSFKARAAWTKVASLSRA